MEPCVRSGAVKYGGRQEKQAVLIRSRVLSGTRAAPACQIKSISLWEAAGTERRGPSVLFAHLWSFQPRCQRSEDPAAAPGAVHINIYINATPMYECRAHGQRSFDGICGSKKTHIKAAHNGSLRVESDGARALKSETGLRMVAGFTLPGQYQGAPGRLSTAPSSSRSAL